MREFFERAATSTRELTAHFHNTRGQGLANVLAALEAGVRSFESSFGELGGCPVPRGATGNIATEDLVSMLHEMGYETGIDLERLVAARARGAAGARPPARQPRAHGRAGRLAPGLRDDVEALAAIERGSASERRARSAEWVAGRLRELGADDVRLEPFRYQPHFAWAHAAPLRRRRCFRPAGGGGWRSLSFELDYSGRSQWLRRLLPAGAGTNVVARLPAEGRRAARSCSSPTTTPPTPG